MTHLTDCSLPPALIYEGSKTFWKTRTALELSIIHHFDHDCVEIVAFHPTFEVEAPRLYLSFSQVIHKTHFQDELHLNVDKEKELSIRRRKYFDLEEVERKIYHESVVQYILARINVVPGLPELMIEVFLQPSFDDVVVYITNKIDVEENRPEGLHPFVIPRKHHSTFENFSHLMEKFHEETEQISANITEAVKHVDISNETMKIEGQMNDHTNNNSLLHSVHRISDAPVHMRVIHAKVPHVRHVNPPVPHFTSHVNGKEQSHGEHYHEGHEKSHHHHHKEGHHHHKNADHHRHSAAHHSDHHYTVHQSEYSQHHVNNRPHSAHRSLTQEAEAPPGPPSPDVATQAPPAPGIAKTLKSVPSLPDVFAPHVSPSRTVGTARRPSVELQTVGGRVTPELVKILSDSHLIMETMETEGRLYSMSSPGQKQAKYYANPEAHPTPQVTQPHGVRAVYVHTKQQDALATDRSRAAEEAHFAKHAAAHHSARTVMPVRDMEEPVRVDALPAVHHNKMSSNPNSRRGSRDSSPVVRRSPSPLLSARNVNGSMVFFDDSDAPKDIQMQKQDELKEDPRGYFTQGYHAHSSWGSSDAPPLIKNRDSTHQQPVPIAGITSTTGHHRKTAPLRSLSADSVEMMMATERNRRVGSPMAGLFVDTSSGSPVKTNYLPPSHSSPSGSTKRSPLIGGGSPSHGGAAGGGVPPRALARGSPTNANNNTSSPNTSRSSSPSNQFTLSSGYVTGLSPNNNNPAALSPLGPPTSLGIAGGGNLSRNPSMKLIDLHGIETISSGDGATSHQLAMLQKLSPTKKSQTEHYLASKTLIPRDFSFDEVIDSCKMSGV